MQGWFSRLLTRPPGDGLLRCSGADRQARHGLFAFLICDDGRFRVEAGHESVFDFVGVAQDVALVEVEHIREIVHAGHEPVDGSRFDDVLPLPSQKLLVEDLLQNWRAHFHRGFQGLAVGGIVDGKSVHETLGVVGLMQSQCGAQRPAVELQGQGNLGIEIEASQQFSGVKAGLAARRACHRRVERPEERRAAQRPVHAGGVARWECARSGRHRKTAGSRACRWYGGLKEILVALDHAAERKAVCRLGKKNLRLHFRVDGLGENFVEGQPEQERTQVVDVGDGAEAVEVAFGGRGAPPGRLRATGASRSPG